MPRLLTRQPLFLRIPPFPRAHVPPLLVPVTPGIALPPTDIAALAQALLRHQVGGTFWSPAQDPWGDHPPANHETTLVQALRSGQGEARLAAAVQGLMPRCPFTASAIGWDEAVEHLAAWRQLIAANQKVDGIYGIARWKRPTLDALLWNGRTTPYARRPRTPAPGHAHLGWHARMPAATHTALARKSNQIGEIEDGFLRSNGLGAHCVPPLSVLVDAVGNPHDPAHPSQLEQMLASMTPSAADLARARALRQAVVAKGVGKYGAAPPAHPALSPPGGAQPRLLVVGQVADDRSLLLAGGGLTNLAMLQRVRAAHPNAHIIYRPHPDVVAGHRSGALSPAQTAGLANHVAPSAPIASLLASVQAVHVISSLTGFEALLRGVPVVCHGAPFYAGWGLTTDLAPMPSRRQRQGPPLSLDAMVAIVLLAYPRYLDPVTGLPCPADVLVQRLAANCQPHGNRALVTLRRWQGMLRQRLTRAIPYG